MNQDLYHPIQSQLTNYTIQFIEDIYDKYEKIASMRNLQVTEALLQGQAALLSKNDFFFFKLLKDCKFSYDLYLIEIPSEFGKVTPINLEE